MKHPARLALAELRQRHNHPFLDHIQPTTCDHRRLCPEIHCRTQAFPCHPGECQGHGLSRFAQTLLDGLPEHARNTTTNLDDIPF